MEFVEYLRLDEDLYFKIISLLKYFERKWCCWERGVGLADGLS